MTKTYVLRWPNQPGQYAQFDYEATPVKARPVPMDEATVFADLDSATLQALLIDSQDSVREWRGCVQETPGDSPC